MSLTREQFVELHKDREYIKTPERLQEVYSIIGSNENVTEMVRLIDEDTFEPCLGFTDKTTGKRYMAKLELQHYTNSRMSGSSGQKKKVDKETRSKLGFSRIGMNNV